MIEVGQDVPGSAFECPAQRDEFGQAPLYARAGQCINFGFHHGLAGARVGRAVGINDVLVGAPSDLERDVLLTGKQVEDAVLLAWGEQAGSGVQASCEPCTGDPWHARADGEVLAGYACGIHPKRCRRGVRRGRDP